MRVLGIDPGLTRCGVGVVEGETGRPLRLVDVGVIRTSSDLPVAERLVSIERGLSAWIEEHRPDAVAVERVFARSDVSTVMGTAQASGIALVCAARHGIAVAMHTPSPPLPNRAWLQGINHGSSITLIATHSSCNTTQAR